VRVLVVDDSLAFRRAVYQILCQRQDFHLVGEASDGLQAVRKAEELQPDLIVLDIGVPKLNGMGGGYVLKAQAGTELLAAVEAVPQGKVCQHRIGWPVLRQRCQGSALVGGIERLVSS
jgi:CheY-like chemotaxis protein